jgi:hypothetical protein
LNAEDRVKRERNHRAARKAYDTIVHLIDRVTFTEGEARFFEENLSRLKCELIALREVF